MLTPRQREVMQFIERYMWQAGMPPTYDEIAAGVGMKSKGQVADVLSRLRGRGYITHTPAAARSIAILKTSEHEDLSVTEQFVWDDDEKCLVPWRPREELQHAS